LTVRDSDAVVFRGRRGAWIGPVDDDAQDRAHRLAAKLHVEDLESVTSCHAFCRVTDARQPFSAHRSQAITDTSRGQKRGCPKNIPEKQKVGTGPLG
jgi:hypothetical protein